MSRRKEKIEILHTPTTHEIFVCLYDMVAYSRLLLEYGPPKPYKDFLKWIIEMNFYKTGERINIKRISADFKTDTSKITKWICQIYENIFELNTSKPELFQKGGTKITLGLVTMIMVFVRLSQESLKIFISILPKEKLEQVNSGLKR